MPTTTNNGWTTPADTDLVKNGALAIRTLGNAIDTTLGVYSAPGLSFINSTTVGTSVSSFSLPANTFTTTYDNYRVIFDGSTMTAAPSAAWRFRFRAGSTDDSTATSYNFVGWNATPSSLSLSNDSSTWAFVGSTLNATPDRFQFIIDISGVALAKETKFMVWGTGMDGGTRRNINVHGFHTVQSAFDSMSFILDSGTITGGKAKVYGYKN